MSSVLVISSITGLTVYKKMLQTAQRTLRNEWVVVKVCAMTERTTWYVVLCFFFLLTFQFVMMVADIRFGSWCGVHFHSFAVWTALLCVARACVGMRFIRHFNVAIRRSIGGKRDSGAETTAAPPEHTYYMQICQLSTHTHTNTHTATTSWGYFHCMVRESVLLMCFGFQSVCWYFWKKPHAFEWQFWCD